MSAPAQDAPGAAAGRADAARARRAWCQYDWANSAFATTVMAALFPPFFRETAIAAGRGEATATALWGYVTAGSLLLTALASPPLGALADARGDRKRRLAWLAGGGATLTMAMALLGGDQWVAAALLFTAASLAFSLSIVCYEALLPHLATGPELDALSARAYGLGYAGGGLLLVVNLAWVLKPAWFGLEGAGQAVRLSFVSVGLWWALFTLPLLRHVPEPPASGEPAGITAALRRLRATFGEIRRHRDLSLLLGAYWVYNDGIGTIVKMATAFGAEHGIALSHLVGALVVTQAVGIPCSYVFAAGARRAGAKPLVLGALVGYTLIAVGALFLRTATHFYLLAAAVGVVQGGAQALSRSLFASMVPRHRAAEFFGFFGASGRLAGVVGPLVFGLTAQAAGTSRVGVASLVVFFVVGGWLLWRVDPAAGVAAARRAEAEAAGAVE
ncbi:MFS transporter [bacterium]|nr:MFS transporter [bacterium]